jgi:two-component system cell cycle response regulator
VGKNDSSTKRRSPLTPPSEDTEADGTIIMQTRELNAVKKIHAALIIIEGMEIGKQFFLRRSLYTIGRSGDVEISIKNDSMISRRHAQIEVIFDQQSNTTQYLLTDLNSTNHTYVNSSQVTKHSLKNGDKIHLGGTTLKFAFLDDIDARFHKEIQQRISYDALTSLLTKESFYLALESEIARCRTNGLPLSLLMIDIDFFKKVNDTYGHQAGSFVLSEMGQLIPANLRDLDLSSRYGGEEFTVLMVEATSQQALIASERLRNAIGNHVFVYEDKSINITISIGIAQYPQDGHTLNELVTLADKALYQCKHTGRNKVCLYSPDNP